MLEFFKLIGSLVFVVLNYFHKTYISRLRPLYSRLANHIVRKQTAFIIIPVSIAFIISYPSLYSVYTTPDVLGCSFVTDIFAKDTFAGSETPLPKNTPGLIIKEAWILPAESPKETQFNITPGALDRSFLSDVFAFQETLLDGIPTRNVDDVFVLSPLDFWDNNLDTFKADKSPLRTVNMRVASPTLGKGISHTGLISGALKVNGVVKSAEAIRIILMYVEKENSTNYGSIWDDNVKNLKNTTSINFVVKSDESIPKRESYVIRLTRMKSCDHVLLGICYALMTLYFLISLSNLKTVTSKLGLLLAFVVEMVLSIMAAATLTTYFFQGVDFFEIPLQFLPFIVMLVGIENMFRLMTTMAKIPGEMSTGYRIIKALEGCGVTSTLVVICDLIFLSLIYPYVVPNSQLFCIFAAFTLIIDHILHLTFFVSVLSIDVHRTELSELIDGTGKKKNSWVKMFYHSEGLSLDGIHGRVIEEESFFKTVLTYMDKISLPFSTTATGSIIAMIFFLCTNYRWMGSTLSSPHKGVSKATEITAVLDKRVFRGVITTLLESEQLDHVSDLLVSVGRPDIAFQGDTAGQLPDKFSLSTSYRFDIYYILEFLTLLVVILSLSLIALKHFTATQDDDDDDRPQQSLIEKEHSFQSKVLSGGHFLDVIKIAVSMSHFIVSIGLDHKVLVWSPISQPMPLPTHLPIGSHIWPITNAVLSDHGNFIALFSKTGLIQCWSRQTMTWVWRVEIPELKNASSLESFFRHKTVPAFLQRKKASELLKTTTAGSKSNSRRNSMRSIASPRLTATLAYANNTDVGNELEELVIVLRSGGILTISCQDGVMKKEVLSTKMLSAISIVPFVGFIVRTTDDIAELIDVQTGILIKSFKIRHFKKGSFRVFHDQPTHCRFCGSASIASFSAVYTLAETKTVVMHTFTVDHKAKTSICLRVERDPREIRCVGFNQVEENVHELAAVDGWCITDKNQIMGIKRKSEDQIQESVTRAKHASLRRRHQSKQRHFTDESAPKLYNLWEGWTMSAHGKIETYDIPDTGNADGLLVNSVGQIARFGHKSIVVAFGNIMKVLYLGNDDLVYHDDDQPANEEISGLTFVNKRRRNIMKKNEKAGGASMNFSEVDGIPGISDLAL
ncbi:Sterol regulatory element-binding protein cleavage-activating protein [Cyberlindnera fabianii]|uniref:Sterol regulatory element-binding protein cleavage-activating protein n=1 Tax=Cyberlindnera fabianii TaxID=36022 RepID=A0A1V2LE61_CYBFA|nr:Sterol regulatory element-binding protein cleavage-activating protein [Cyberlindnera fabianii]